ncbi:MAG: FAD-dependent oxidoreductase [Dehalococcoidia bacterium]|nr:FAD-dependent oxidoreductase [Dehalococcoidia bacterium]MDZ4246639.1 FAD-dependent oxidoreductase [Dehalococcoidia bacterium]
MYENLLKPGKIGKLTIKNRMKYAATVNNFCNPDGSVGDKEIAYLEERAKGGFGIVVSQGGYTDIEGKGYKLQMGLDKDEFIPGLTKLATAIKKHGAVAISQLMHTGRYGHADEYGLGKGPIGPTAMQARIPRYHPCREMSLDEIKQSIEAHGQAARRIKAAGFDGVEICGIVGYLISNFLCAWTNKRTDEYGGTLEKRAKFMLDILRRVRKEVGPDYPVMARLNATDHIEGGNTDEEYIQIGKWLVEEGIDALSISIGWHESSHPALTMQIPPGGWLYYAENFKKEIKSIPITMAYRLNTPAIPNKAVGDGVIDFWEVCRPGIADPFFPKKIIEGRAEEINVCPACNLGCFMRLFNDSTMACMVNPRVGREFEEAAQIRPADVKKKVMVVGGGPGGMEAARVAAARGHDVTLYEKTGRLGGQLNLAGATPYCDDWKYMIGYYQTMMKKLGVKVHLNSEVTAQQIDKDHPDAVIVATGAKEVRPSVPGLDKASVVMAFDIIDGKATTGKNVLVWGGRAVGVQTGELLASQGKTVTIVDDSKRIGRDINAFNIWGFRQRLAKAKVTLLLGSKVERVTPEGVVVSTDGKEQTVKVDTIVLAAGLEPNKALIEELGYMSEVEEIHSVGDCVAPRKAYNAVHDGFRIGLKV